jgi:hypothetical protein
MDPKTGTFMSMDTFQGNMHDPMSLHKYMYANANPIGNIDPTGMITEGLLITAILDSANMPNYSIILDKLLKGAYAIQLIQSDKNVAIAILTEDIHGLVESIANGLMNTVELLDAGKSALVMNILRNVLPKYGTEVTVDAFLKALEQGDTTNMLQYGMKMLMEIITIYSACFDGDTLIATEDGFKRIDEIQAGDRVWSYNVETSEKRLKEVKQVFVKESNEILHLETTEGGIDATTNHPFYVIGKGWVAAGDLVVGDEIHTLDGDAGTLTGFKLEKLDEPMPVYNLEVKDFQSYFVGNGVLVHNVCLQGIGSTGRTEPKNLMEEMAYEAAKADPLNWSNGNTIRRVIASLNDPRWPGWEKWEIVVRSKNGKNVTIHFVYDPINELFDDFKLKN